MGIVISLVQIATSMQDNAFSTIPRLVAFLVGLLLLLALDAAKDHGRTRWRCSETCHGMPASLTLSAATLFAFLLVLARVGGALIFVPSARIQGWHRSRPAPPSQSVSPWPCIRAGRQWRLRRYHPPLLAWVGAEAALGIAIGLSVAIVLEAFALAAQVLGLQAGYAYASTIDPNSEADSGVLLVFAQLIAGLLFFALGLDREFLRLFALSLERVPAGQYTSPCFPPKPLIRLGASLFSVGLRLALPVVALLVMVDVALALLGRAQCPAPAAFARVSGQDADRSGAAELDHRRLFPRMLLELAGHAWNTVGRMLGS